MKCGGVVKYISLFATLILLVSCGIEDYPYIYSIPTGNIRNDLNSRIRVYIPNDNSTNAYFTNYVIFYRIYISDVDILSPSEYDYPSINSSLNNDHSRIRPYIGNDSMGSSSIDSLFRNLKYYPLLLDEGIDLNNILSAGNSVFGKYLVIDFTRDSENETIPYLSLATLANLETSTRYSLQRSDGVAGNYEPRPGNRYFLNTQDLLSQENIDDPTINGDVTDKPNAAKRKTYVSMYIIASGIDSQTFVQLYSSPAHIGVLQLPDPN